MVPAAARQVIAAYCWRNCRWSLLLEVAHQLQLFSYSWLQGKEEPVPLAHLQAFVDVLIVFFLGQVCHIGSVQLSCDMNPGFDWWRLLSLQLTGAKFCLYSCMS